MQVLRVLDMPTAIPLGAYLGGNYGQQAVLDKLNSVWNTNGSGVLFGQSVWGDRYAAFTQTITARDNEAFHAVERTLDVTLRPNKILPIESLEDLEQVPPCMYQAILTMPQMRKLYDEGMIRGWGVEPQDLPQEDVAELALFVLRNEAHREGPVFGPGDETETLQSGFPGDRGGAPLGENGKPPD